MMLCLAKNDVSMKILEANEEVYSSRMLVVIDFFFFF